MYFVSKSGVNNYKQLIYDCPIQYDTFLEYL